MIKFTPFTGHIVAITDFQAGTAGEAGCNKLMSVQSNNGVVVNFVVTPSTYFLDHVMVKIDDLVTGYYDANAPAPLIFPPSAKSPCYGKT